MRTHRVCIGELLVEGDSRIDLYAELSNLQSYEHAAKLREQLSNLLGNAFRPAPGPHEEPRLGIPDVADLLGCGCEGVQRLVKRGALHPVSDEDGDLYFDPAEIRSIKHVSLSPTLSRIVQQN
jgi:hypothetical protein